MKTETKNIFANALLLKVDPETREVVKKWVDFYKEYRQILDADIVHLRRPDGKSWDGIMHVDPEGEEKGLIMLYNPGSEDINKSLTFDLYYTGLQEQVMLSQEAGDFSPKDLKDETFLTLDVLILANGWTWYVVR